MEHQELDQWVEQLEKKVDDAENGDRNWRDIWDEVRQIRQEFRSTRYPTKADKDAALDRFQEAVERMKEYQAQAVKRREQQKQQSQQRQEEWTRKVEISRGHAEEIVRHAESGRPPSGLEELLAASVLLPVEVVANVLTLGQAGSLFDHREALKYWSQRIHEAWDLFTEHKQEMLGRDRKGVFDRLKELQAECDEAWAHFRGAQGQAREARERQQEERQRRHDEWRERKEAKRERLQALLEKNEGVIERLEEQIEDLEEKISTAWNEEWADRAMGWVEEKREKIRDIETTNEELAKNIREIDDQLVE